MHEIKIRKAAERSASENLSSFIDSMRRHNPLAVADWTAICWELGMRKRQSAGREDRIWFNRNFTKKVTVNNAEPFPELFGEFLRAVVCSRELARATPLDSNDHMILVRAYRYLYSSAASRAEGPTELRRLDFDEAAEACRNTEAASSAYRVGCKLEEIARVMDREYLTSVRLNWTNPIRRDSYAGGALQNRTSREFFERRQDKLPSEDILDALADIANRTDLSPADLLRQRALELYLCGGFRANELLTLPRDCWVDESQRDVYGEQVLDRFGQPVVRYGLRYIPEKKRLNALEVKWLPSVMVDIAKRAVQDILRITERFALIADYMHSHPGSTRLPEPWHSAADETLVSMEDVVTLVGLDVHPANRGTAGRQFVRLAGLPLTSMRGQKRSIQAVTKQSLVSELCKRSASSTVFPDGQAHYRLHECLFVVGVNFIGAQRSTLNGTATLVTQGQIDDYLTDREVGARSAKGTQSIFSRLGYHRADGSPVTGTTHQFRHWLNTLAQEGGLSQMEISRWMGRKSVRDNAAYDHQTGFELARRVRTRLEGNEVIGSIGTTLQGIKDPVRRSEFARSAVASAHITDLGMCIQDLSAIPCERHRDCVTCNKHLVEKGNEAQRSLASELRNEAELLLKLADNECAEDSYGADNWREHQKLTLKKAEAILAVHDDDSIQDGTLVQVALDEGDQTD
ncbi:hypothetical protein B0G76_7430 [Paraburkholderia sp. BL23I1N1]|uniref:hypothetical protein n=1 Tax=Paraburkholderia sp. BL23I1N1 TaxID=1938802 RepID=UPI000E74F3B9|nr:hypothetical protein [Paraburkholderia sp. BL23I1N1]RKE25873.1 hypothetical protein B0G76_7430 [Paraburkholderia sp. BL23I1N1]